MRSQIKTYYYCFLFWGKKSDCIFKNLKFLQKKIFLHKIFSRVRTEGEIFQKFSSDFNKQGLKWKFIITASYLNFEEKS